MLRPHTQQLSMYDDKAGVEAEPEPYDGPLPRVFFDITIGGNAGELGWFA